MHQSGDRRFRCDRSPDSFAPHAAGGDRRPGLSCAPPARVRLPVPGRRRLDPGQTASDTGLSRALSSSTIRIPGRRSRTRRGRDKPPVRSSLRCGLGRGLLRRGRCRAPSGVRLHGTVPVRARIQLPVRRVQVNASTLKSLDGGGRRTRRDALVRDCRERSPPILEIAEVEAAGCVVRRLTHRALRRTAANAVGPP